VFWKEMTMKVKNCSVAVLDRFCVLGASAVLLLIGCKRQVEEAVTDAGHSVLHVSEHHKGLTRQSLTAAEGSRFGRLSLGMELGVGEQEWESSQEDYAQAKSLLERLSSGPVPADLARDVMAEARMIEGEAVFDVIGRLMEHPDEEVRAEAMTMLDGVDTPKAGDLLKKGLMDESDDIRRLAMESAQNQQGEIARELVEAGLVDGDAGVRQMSLFLAMKQGEEYREQTILKAMPSQYADLALSALAEAEATPNPRYVPGWIQSLGHPNAEVREVAREILFFQFHESFDSPDQARKWWQDNQNQYDQDLVLRD
jgi:hypothetical protein